MISRGLFNGREGIENSAPSRAHETINLFEADLVENVK